MFQNFVKDDGEVSRVLMIYFILNGYDISKVDKAIELIETPSERCRMETVYGETREGVDIKSINEEVSSIITPTICSLQSYQMYVTSPVIYCFSPLDKGRELCIDDLGIISSCMVIQPDLVVASNEAKPFQTAQHGFSVFMDYVLKGKCQVGNWTIQYTDTNEFIVTYTSKNGGNEEILYKALEFEKTSTFRLVLYIIKKTCETLNSSDEWSISENYMTEKWKRNTK